MAETQLRIIPDIVEEHAEEVAFLWGQRQEALRSPEYVLPELIELEGRIEAHVQGLLVGGEHTLPIIEEGLADDDPLVVFATAYAFLRLHLASAAERVMEAFLEAEPPQLDGMRQALCHAPIKMVTSQLQEALASAGVLAAVTTAEALAFHEKLDSKVPRLDEFLQDENVPVRCAAWRLVMLSSSPLLWGPEMSSRLSAAVTNDEDPAVREQALHAAAWTRQPWLLEHCRKMAGEPSPENWDALLLLAVLGKPMDLNQILAIAGATELGPKRFRVLGAFGHPQVVEIVLENMKSEDPLTAVAAGAAFKKITGMAIESDRRVQIPPEDDSEPDEFEQEFLDEVTLPDPKAAQAHWKKVREEFSGGTRWCNGHDLTQPAGEDILNQLDLESRWEACLRGRFEGTWQHGLADLEVFPQKQA